VKYRIKAKEHHKNTSAASFMTVVVFHKVAEIVMINKNMKQKA